MGIFESLKAAQNLIAGDYNVLWCEDVGSQAKKES